MKPPFRLVHQDLSHETVQALEHLLREAQRGRIIGVAFVAMTKRREYLADTTGEAFRNPTFARGMLASLDDHLAELVRKVSRN